MAQYAYLGSGQVYLSKYGEDGLKEIGNVTELSLSITEDVKELTDFTKPGGGTYAEVRRVTAAELSATLSDYSPDNLARALYGGADAVTAGAVTGEKIRASSKGQIYVTTSLIDTAQPVTVKLGTAALVAGTDYRVTRKGVVILDSSTKSFSDTTELTIDYTRAASDTIEGLIDAGKEYRMLFDGLNESRSGKASVVDLYRVKLGAVSDLSFISDDFGSIAVTGKLLPDNTKSGEGKSRYFNMAIER